MRDAEVIVDSLELVYLDEEWGLPCEMSSHEEVGSGPAEWIMWFSCPCENKKYKLACPSCKDHKLAQPALRCLIELGGCGQLFTPGSLAYRLVEPLNKS